jgi:hypothetical protein
MGQGRLLLFQQPKEVRGSTNDAKGRHRPCLPVIVSGMLSFRKGSDGVLG